jgi:hypothetical protein
MPRDAQLFSKIRRSLWRLLLVPFLLLTLMPPGVMPHRAADGQLRLVLCTENGPVETVIDLATGQEVPAEPDDGRCDWAAAHPAAVPGGVAPDLAWPVVLARVERLALAPVWQPRALPGAVRARAPPHIL